MSKRTEQEKREYVRTTFSIPARIRLIDREEVEHPGSLQTSIPPHIPAETGASLPEASEHVIPAISYLARSLVQINDKLDRIIQLLGGDPLQENSIGVKETCNTSGSGVSLVLPRSVDVGQLLEVWLSIPDFPMGGFQTHGEVIRVTPLKESESGLFEVGIKFLNIQEEDRERLISFTFRQQRRNIREFKNHT